jgi:hypothetical protein
MEITLTREIAALVMEVQERQKTSKYSIDEAIRKSVSHLQYL